MEREEGVRVVRGGEGVKRGKRERSGGDGKDEGEGGEGMKRRW